MAAPLRFHFDYGSSNAYLGAEEEEADIPAR
jgi:hypothetical protein